jgi:serine/threonine protein kinase
LEPSLPKLPAPFLLSRQIACGASSTVFEAFNEVTRQSVALKVFHPQVIQDAQFIERLQREAEALTQIRHPNVVQLIQSWSQSGLFFLELELVNGRTLKQWQRDEPADWLEPRLWIAIEVARALGAAHQQQIVHRDLKPENILLSTAGQVKLTDFGLAKSQTLSQGLTQTGSLIGSLAYMAPETVEGAKASYASDIFSFGAVTYELLCGRQPFTDAEGQLQLRELLAGNFISTAARNPKVPQEVAELVDQCLHKDPAQRPSSIWRVEAALLEYLQATGVLRLARSFVHGEGDRSQLLFAGLQLKHQLLKTEIGELAQQATQRKKLLAKIKEFSALFPDDLFWQQSLTQLREPELRRKSKLWWISVPLGAVVVTSAILFTRSPEPPAVIVALPVIAPPVASMALPPEPPTTVAKPIALPVIPKRAPIASRPRLGSLHVLTDNDVNVTVDGLALSAQQLAGYTIRPGQHLLRLDKAGFRSIEKIIQVAAGKTTTINARSAGDQ